MDSGAVIKQKNQSKPVPVVLSGGAGSRLWPVSRASFPKQLWPLVTEKTLLQETVLRTCKQGFASPLIVCNQEHRFLVAEQLREVGVEHSTIILEPEGRNSAPAMAAAACFLANSDPETVMLVMAADAAIGDVERFIEVVEPGIKAAEEGYFVTFGIKPDKPATGYGYICAGQPLTAIENVYHIKGFYEKPDKAQAEKYLQTGQYLWNAGIFVCKASTLIAEMALYTPTLLQAVKQSVDRQHVDLDFIRLEENSFKSAPHISIDYAIAEKTKKSVVIPADFGWSDVGSWDVLWDIGRKDADGNVGIGVVELLDTKNSYVRSENHLTVLLGVENLVVVNTGDATLVMDKAKAQQVKEIVERIEKRGLSQARLHNRMYRPWGYYEQLALGERFQVKKLVVWPEAKLSLQKHFHRAEHWVVVQGLAKVTQGTKEILLKENESIYIPFECLHRLENAGDLPLVMIEIQSGHYLGEDDIVRFDDHYNRL
ncbi:mannose-1-phosphate guanylyltransferase/mannose-6-phosphate isomerase [Entomobacter blattae]|uniref:mannose-1-phosphate guanylyltransferase n=1 Tax=Entomobacter blattae TaxID=2762277 RepID=A0A7H1NNL9_9PROT|nr:mannose-1-phosphate guanylyltransferase/mannose-6-phosphate isomerase [Entomobacter blattae]QNT77379.1 Mannose-1-phosphate guanylyltransferase 1 [Entomobacter blattae]